MNGVTVGKILGSFHVDQESVAVGQTSHHGVGFLLGHFFLQLGKEGFVIEVHAGVALGAKTFVLDGDEVIHVDGSRQVADDNSYDDADNDDGCRNGEDQDVLLVREEAGAGRGGRSCHGCCLGSCGGAAVQTELAVVFHLCAAFFTKHNHTSSF